MEEMSFCWENYKRLLFAFLITSLVSSILPVSPANANPSSLNVKNALPTTQVAPQSDSSPILVQESRDPATRSASLVSPLGSGPKNAGTIFSESTTRIVVSLSTRIIGNIDTRKKLDGIELSKAKAEFTTQGMKLATTYGSPRVATVSNFLARTGSALQVWEYSNPSTAQENLARIRSNPLVLNAFPDRILQIQKTPNDEFYSKIWGMTAIRAPSAWDKRTGGKEIIVAVIDTGIDLTHPDLVDNLWSNPGEVPGNGVDDDGNGRVDDRHGWDYVDDDGTPNDDVAGWAWGHGTHVAGTIGGKGNNSIGVAGVNWDVSLMALRICGAYGCYLSDFWEAITYAYNEGAQVANASFGGPYAPFAEEQAVIASVAEPGVDLQKGVLLVAAAGNYGSNNDTQNFCPACYQLPNVVSVSATRAGDSLAGFSNYGKQKVTIAAPGESIFSTIPTGAFGINNRYGYLSGTSMAAPQVSGGAALFFSQSPSWRPSQVKNALIKSARRVSSLSSKVLSGGIMDVNALLSVSSPPNPFVFVDFLGTGKGSISINSSRCESTCFAEITTGQNVTLTAEPAQGATFEKWSGNCDGSTSRTCSFVQTDSSTRATAWFSQAPEVTHTQSQIRSREELPVRTEDTGYFPWDNGLSMTASSEGTISAYGVMRWPKAGWCFFTSSDMGGVAAVNASTGTIEKVWRAPYWPGSEARDRIWNCRDFGKSVSISADGRTLVTGLGWDYSIDFNNEANDWFRCGVVVYRKLDNGLWNEGTVIAPSNLKDCFHVLQRTSTSFSAYINWYNPVLSRDGKKLFVRGVNQVHVFDLNNGESIGYQNAKLPSECITTTAQNFQGFASHIKPLSSGEELLIGATSCKDSTEAYLFNYQNSSWSVAQKFGRIPGNTWSVGAAVSTDGEFIAISYAGSGNGVSLYSKVNGQWNFLRDLNSIKPFLYMTMCDFAANSKQRIICTNPYVDVGNNIQQGVILIYDSENKNWTSQIYAATLWNTKGKPTEGISLTWTNSKGTKFQTVFGGTTVGNPEYDFHLMGTAFDYGELANLTPPKISGDAAINKTMTATPGTWSGSPSPRLSYQWVSCTNNTSTDSCTNIEGATKTTLTLTSGQVGKHIRVKETATLSGLTGEAFSAASAPVGSAPVASGNLSITGTASVGSTLTQVNELTWSGFPVPTITTQWVRCDSAVRSQGVPRSTPPCQAIDGATANTYQLTSADSGKFIAATRIATSTAGTVTFYSASTTTAVGMAPANTALPTIAGSPAVNQSLSATPGTWSGSPSPRLSYQWVSCTNNTSTDSCTNIEGATRTSIRLSANEIGRYIRIKETGTNSITATAAFSAASAPVGSAPVASGNLSITGTASVGSTLTQVNELTWSGFPVPTITTQWVRCDSAVRSQGVPRSTPPCQAIDGATANTYQLTSADSGKFIAATRIATSTAGTVTFYSASTTTAVGMAPANTALPTIAGSPAVNQSLSATPGTWSGSPSPRLSYQWVSCTNNTSTDSCTNIEGATRTSIRLTSDLVGRYIRIKEIATNAISTESVYSAVVGPVVSG